MVAVEEAPGSSRPGLVPDLEEPTTGFNAAQSTQASWPRLLLRERATASARLSREERGVISWEGPLRLRGLLEDSAQPALVRVAWQRLLPAQQLAKRFRRWLRGGSGWSGNGPTP